MIFTTLVYFSDAVSSSSHNSDTPGIGDWTPPEASRNRRKGPAFKVDQALLHRLQEMNSMDDVETIEIVQPQSPLEAGFTYQPSVEGSRKRLLNPSSMNGRTGSLQYSCGSCGISFGDVEMFELHASFHKPSAPFTCTSCGYAATDRVDFYRHIAQVAHVWWIFRCCNFFFLPIFFDFYCPKVMDYGCAFDFFSSVKLLSAPSSFLIPFVSNLNYLILFGRLRNFCELKILSSILKSFFWF